MASQKYPNLYFFKKRLSTLDSFPIFQHHLCQYSLKKDEKNSIMSGSQLLFTDWNMENWIKNPVY